MFRFITVLKIYFLFFVVHQNTRIRTSTEIRANLQVIIVIKNIVHPVVIITGHHIMTRRGTIAAGAKEPLLKNPGMTFEDINAIFSTYLKHKFVFINLIP